MSQEGPDNRAFISSCSVIEMQRGIEIAGFHVRVCHCLRFTAQCREGGIRGKRQRERGRGTVDGYLGENRASQVVLRQHFGGSKDDPRVVGGKKKKIYMYLK